MDREVKSSADNQLTPCARIGLMSKHTAVATLHTNYGDIKVNLFGNHAPKTVRNFVGLATGETEWTHPATGEKTTTPLYDGVIFHRIIPAS